MENPEEDGRMMQEWCNRKENILSHGSTAFSVTIVIVVQVYIGLTHGTAYTTQFFSSYTHPAGRAESMVHRRVFDISMQRELGRAL